MYSYEHTHTVGGACLQKGSSCCSWSCNCLDGLIPEVPMGQEVFAVLKEGCKSIVPVGLVVNGSFSM